MTLVTKFDQWPLWLQLLIGIPNAIILSIVLWLWWPKKEKETNRFIWISMIYLLGFFLFYHFFG